VASFEVLCVTDDEPTTDVYRGRASVKADKADPLPKNGRISAIDKLRRMGGCLRRVGLHVFCVVNQTRKTIFALRAIYNRRDV